MLSLLTLISSALSLYGVSEIYKGKKSESDKKTTWGILMFGLGVIAIALLNPVFDSFFLSLIVATGFSAFTIGLIANTFLNTKKDSEPVIVEIQNEQKNNQQVLENVDTIDAVGRSTPIPVGFLQDAKNKVAIAKSRFVNFR